MKNNIIFIAFTLICMLFSGVTPVSATELLNIPEHFSKVIENSPYPNIEYEYEVKTDYGKFYIFKSDEKYGWYHIGENKFSEELYDKINVNVYLENLFSERACLMALKDGKWQNYDKHYIMKRIVRAPLDIGISVVNLPLIILI